MFKPSSLPRRFAPHATGTRKLWLLLALTAGALLALAACAPRPSLAPAPPPPQPSQAQTAKPLVPVADVRTERRALSAEEARDYLGDAVCASCHKDIAALHARSRHAHTLRPVSTTQDGQFFRKAPAVKDPPERLRLCRRHRGKSMRPAGLQRQQGSLSDRRLRVGNRTQWLYLI